MAVVMGEPVPRDDSWLLSIWDSVTLELISQESRDLLLQAVRSCLRDLDRPGISEDPMFQHMPEGAKEHWEELAKWLIWMGAGTDADFAPLAKAVKEANARILAEFEAESLPK